jgi:Cys-tRNA(Pro)/Cys-tRNA(Cys) deacylase
MKKAFPTTLHCTAEGYEKIFFSGGKVGYQVEVAPKDLEKIVRVQYADVIVHN